MDKEKITLSFWEQVTQSAESLFVVFWEKLPAILLGLIVLGIFIFMGIFFKRMLKRRLKRKYNDQLLSNFSGDLLKWSLFIVGVMITLYIIGFGGVLTSILAGAGVSAIIFGFAFKDIAENFLAGLLLAINRPFNVGDLVEVEGFRGTVKRLELRTTHLRVADGSDIFIPNSMLVKAVLTNFTKDGLFRLDFIVGVDPEADLNKVIHLILEMLKNDPVLLQEPKPSVTVDELATNAINIKVRFWMDAFKANTAPEFTGPEVKSRVIHATRNLMLENGIGMPANVLEHKMYKSDQPLEVKLSKI